jgi:periplasmic protein TonB
MIAALVLWGLTVTNNAVAQTYPAPMPYATPVPYPTPAPGGSSCPETDVQLVKAAQPEYPAAAMKFIIDPVSVQVIVMVNADGSVQTASVARSSGYSQPDAAALKAAEDSTYKPKTVNCKPVRGLYLFQAEFKPQQ